MELSQWASHAFHFHKHSCKYNKNKKGEFAKNSKSIYDNRAHVIYIFKIVKIANLKAN